MIRAEERKPLRSERGKRRFGWERLCLWWSRCQIGTEETVVARAKGSGMRRRRKAAGAAHCSKSAAGFGGRCGGPASGRRSRCPGSQIWEGQGEEGEPSSARMEGEFGRGAKGEGEVRSLISPYRLTDLGGEWGGRGRGRGRGAGTDRRQGGEDNIPEPSWSSNAIDASSSWFRA